MAVSFPLLSVPIAIFLAYLPHFLRVFLIKRSGKYDNTKPRDMATQISSVPEDLAALCTRLASCHQNQLELLGPYAAGVVASVAVGEDNTALVVLSALYLAFRVAYIAAYAAPQVVGGYVRSLMFVGCMAMVISIWSKAAI